MNEELLSEEPPKTIVETDTREGKSLALCLSGGGYRAMLFHVGMLWRLNEAGLLSKMDRISSVSGGSIAAGFLAIKWNTLGLDQRGAVSTNFVEEYVTPVRALARKTLDIPAGLISFLPFFPAANVLSRLYRRYAFGDVTLQDLPDSPRFVFNATNLQSGVLWRFSKPYCADYRVGKIDNPTFFLADAVAASSAFPPFLSPLVLRLAEGQCQPQTGVDLHRPPFTTRVLLSDGGVYDNLGLETVIKSFQTVLVSDGGGQMQPEDRVLRNWFSSALRVNSIIDNQVRSLRKRQLFDANKTESRKCIYWGIREDIQEYKLQDALLCPHEATLKLAAAPTRLSKFSDPLQERLINWGYAVCDAAIRARLDPSLPAPSGFPYEKQRV
jgi:NTE family protein